MSVFTKTTKGKVMGLMLAVAVIGAVLGTIALVAAGNVHAAISAGGMVLSILTVGVGAAGYLREQEWKAAAAERRARLYA